MYHLTLLWLTLVVAALVIGYWSGWRAGRAKGGR